jgi:hypothetical protein
MNDLDMKIEIFIIFLSLFYCLLYMIYIFINPTILTHWIFPFIAFPCVTEMLLYPLTYITPIFTYSLVIATILFCLFPHCIAYIMFPCLFFTITAISNISISELLIKNLEDDEFQLRSILLNFSGPMHHGIRSANKSDINHIKIIISKLINFKLTRLSQENELIQNDPNLLKMVIDRAERDKIPEIFKAAGEETKKECFLQAWEKNSIIWLDAPNNFKNQDTMLEKTLSDPFNVRKIESIFQTAGKEAQEKCYLSAWNKTPTVFIYAPEIYKNDSDHLKETIKRSADYIIPEIFKEAGEKAKKECFLEAWQENSYVWLHVPDNYMNHNLILETTLYESNISLIPEIFSVAGEKAKKKCYLQAWNKNPTVFIDAPEIYKSDSDHLKETIERSERDKIPQIFLAASKEAQEKCYLQASEKNSEVSKFAPEKYRANAPHFILVN